MKSMTFFAPPEAAGAETEAEEPAEVDWASADCAAVIAAATAAAKMIATKTGNRLGPLTILHVCLGLLRIPSPFPSVGPHAKHEIHGELASVPTLAWRMRSRCEVPIASPIQKLRRSLSAPPLNRPPGPSGPRQGGEQPE